MRERGRVGWRDGVRERGRREKAKQREREKSILTINIDFHYLPFLELMNGL